MFHLTMSSSVKVRTRNGQNNGKTTQCRYKIVRVCCIERTLVVSTFRYSFVCLQCVTPVSVQYSLCLVTVHMKVTQNGRLARFSKRAGCWYAFSWIVRNQNGHFINLLVSELFFLILTHPVYKM